MEKNDHLANILSTIFNNTVELTGMDYGKTPSAPIVIDFNDISTIYHNDQIVYTNNKKYVPGSIVKLKNGDKHIVTELPDTVNEKIKAQRETNEAKLKSLGIRIII